MTWVYGLPLLVYVLRGDDDPELCVWTVVEVWAGPPASLPQPSRRLRPAADWGPWLVASSCPVCRPATGYICRRHR